VAKEPRSGQPDLSKLASLVEEIAAAPSVVVQGEMLGARSTFIGVWRIVKRNFRADGQIHWIIRNDATGLDIQLRVSFEEGLCLGEIQSWPSRMDELAEDIALR